MSTAGLFTVGVLVTLIVAAAMALLIYAAILDGRDAAARRAADREPPAPRRAVNILQTAPPREASAPWSPPSTGRD